MATKKVDPRIFLPIVEGYEYDDSGTPNVSAEESAVEEIVIGPPRDGSLLQPPERVAVVDQISRKAADGRSVVDIVLEVEDVVGATEYEVRTSIV